MFRAFFFLIKIGILAVALLWFIEHPGTVHVVWQGYEIDTSVGVVAAALFFLLVAVLLLDRLWRALINVPMAIKRWRRAQGREAGFDEIAAGLVALSAGDEKAALKRLKRARALVPGAALSGVLAAGVARMAGDESGARLAFENLLDDQRVAFLGLKGLLRQALEKGDHAGALDLARRAEKTHPKQGWIVKTLFDLEIRARHWKEADLLLGRLLKLGAVGRKEGLRQRQALLLAMAREEADGGRAGDALKLARFAFDMDPAFVPAAAMSAGLLAKEGKRRKALKTVKAAWAQAPHPDLADLWMRLAPPAKGKTEAERRKASYEWASELAGLASFSLESRRLLGLAAMEAQMWDEAREHLKAVGDYRSLSKVEKAETGSEARAREWLELAADLPPERRWVCGGCGHFEFSWGPLCPRCGAFDCFSWDTPGFRTKASDLPAVCLPPSVF